MWIRRHTALASCLACPTVVWACAANAATTLINFDNRFAMTHLSENAVPTAARLSTEFQDSLGVRFSSQAGYVALVDLGFGHATSPTNGIGGVRSGDVLNYNQDIELTFSVPGSGGATPGITDFFSIRGDLDGNDTDTVTLTAFDANGQLIGSDSELDVGGITLSVAQPGVHRIVVSGVAVDAVGNGGVAFDDVMFNSVTPVPEPSGATLTLIGSALAARRRRPLRLPE